jgi:Flp pilus assembly protein TadG
MVEFALAVPVFLVLIMLTFEAGRLIFTWSCLMEGGREGARIAVLSSTTSTTPVSNAALNLTSWMGVTSSNVSVLRNGSVVTGSFSKTRGDAMSVKITYTYVVFIAQGMGPAWPGLPFASLPITVKTQMRAEG